MLPEAHSNKKLVVNTRILNKFGINDRSLQKPGALKIRFNKCRNILRFVPKTLPAYTGGFNIDETSLIINK